MKIKFITHADFETPGVLLHWAQKNHHTYEIVKPYRGQDCLAQSNYDLLIVMGGPQSPLKLNEFPYLRDEITLIQQALSSRKPILGFCLGAQLMGEALGAHTEKSPEKEIGVYPITLTEPGTQDSLFSGFPKTFNAIHWHNDMPGLTADSTVYAYSEGCPRQIVRYTDCVYGFQCHLEIELSGMDALIKACPEDLSPSKFTQTAAAIRSTDYTSIHNHLFHLLDKFTQPVCS
ncbi:MAG: GMP synthase [Verrucomicrobia bacterium CG_4_10_14_3_um_filter_43_23]|nr:MAG: hypothetical protein AUJ82_04335 [Verrucomicrobia bacterium CG1_02_43_26]PIP59073.1 MAG: GMP synthase [Verrucomicrobia bacterium CG22_combo_CG10-13_8_21_14_all_43_17]PIX59170.1 MAG: GMP synthase [Verrucomicrobia bacterium CG_4_10_14_3_um_filter_43_23]PIY61305.1 MAG: GMP synthase [Verrucomicrobia bacterium CG_4_10_14_0_8_um_filter_43_34]PJA44087.1 MAG: GMP synthase [Verrucomicrobia bacterium CG_4_9_14_3_um_filter_43_20]